MAMDSSNNPTTNGTFTNQNNVVTGTDDYITHISPSLLRGLQTINCNKIPNNNKSVNLPTTFSGHYNNLNQIPLYAMKDINVSNTSTSYNVLAIATASSNGNSKKKHFNSNSSKVPTSNIGVKVNKPTTLHQNMSGTLRRSNSTGQLQTPSSSSSLFHQSK